MKQKVLIVEDDADTRAALGMRLRAMGLEVAFASDGVLAVSQALKEHPDLVVLDLGLPAGDGFRVLERLRELGATAATPVIVVSARDAAVNRPKALRSGAAAYLEKPIDNTQLGIAVRKHLPASHRDDDAEAPTVLIIEDDDDTRRGLVIRLRAAGFDPHTAADAVTGLGAAVECPPDVILLDLGLPGGDGIDLLGRFRSHAKLGAVPVVVLSARPEATTRQRALAAGAVAYLQKPADNRELVVALRRATRSAAPV